LWESVVDDIASPDNLWASNRREYKEKGKENERVLEYSKYSWKYRKRLGDYLTPVPRPRWAFYSKFCARSNVECARREILRGYLIYVIERARGGYLNNAIRILFPPFDKCIPAVPYRPFLSWKRRKRYGKWELDGGEIDEGGYLGDRSIRQV